MSRLVITPALEQLRADLADITPTTITVALTPLGAAALEREQRVPGLMAARAAATPSAVVARLFLLGDTVPTDDVERAFPHTGTVGLAELGLVHIDAGSVTAAVDLRSIQVDADVVWLASDLGERVTGRALESDHVMGVGKASLTLASITDRRPVGSALDLGTGSGIQAALFGSHTAHIVATDLSERALDFARFNAALNGHTWDLRAGSLFEPVAGERFDLIVSNPPFVITPRAAYDAGLPVMEYRDGTDSSDHLLAAILQDLPRHLTDTGRAIILANWEHHDGEDWRDRLARIAPADLDLWVIEREYLDPAQYVELWLRDGGKAEGAERETIYAAWLGDFQRRGVEAIGFGYVIAAVAQPGRPPLRRFEAVATPVSGPLGAHLASCFDMQRQLQDICADGTSSSQSTGTSIAYDDVASELTEPSTPSWVDVVGEWTVIVAPDVTVEHHYMPGSEDPSVILLRQGAGLSRTHRMSTALASLINVADGDLTVAQTSYALAQILDLDEAALATELATEVCELLATGFLTLSGSDTSELR